MRQRLRGLLAGFRLVLALLLGAGGAQASTFDVVINSALLSGNPAVLVFDFLDGGPPDNTVTLSALTSNGNQGAATILGNVTGTGPWIFSDAGPSFFNELQVLFNPMGSALSFSFTTTDNPPEAGSVPDAFSLFILNEELNAFLVTTDAPLESNALFLYSIGAGAEGLTIYTPSEQGFSFSVTPVQAAPEPTSLALLAAGMFALLSRRRFLI